MLHEGFWMFLSFLFLIGILFKFIKKSVISSLDRKIQSVEDSITNGAKMKKSANEKLISLKVDYDKALLQYENIILEAKTEAENIISNTEAKVKLLDERSLDLISEYRKQSDMAMVESLKGDILMTILNLIESEQRQDSVAQMKGVGNSISVMKKIWT